MPSRRLSRVTEGHIAVALDAARRIEGWMAEEELRWLACRALDHHRIVEVGSWKGRSTKALAGSTLGRVFAVDHFCGSRDELLTFHKEASERGPDVIYGMFCENLALEIVSGSCVPLRLSSVQAVRSMGHLLCPDFVFIDAEHTYEAVLSDLVSWKGVCAPHAFMAGHDFHLREVKRAVLEVFGSVGLGPDSLWYVQL